jgi:hypothetical protein
MLITLLMIQAILTLILNQTHQSMVAQLQTEFECFPVYPTHDIAACLNGNCSDKIIHFLIQPISSIHERQYFNATITLCENGQCYQITQVFSDSSAILKGERHFHAATVGHM